MRGGERGLGLGQPGESAVRALNCSSCERAPVEGGQGRGRGGKDTGPGSIPVEEVAVSLGNQVGESRDEEDDGHDSLQRREK